MTEHMDRFYDSSIYCCLLKNFAASELLNSHSVSIYASSLEKIYVRAIFNKLYRSSLLLTQFLNLHVTWNLLYTWKQLLSLVYILQS